MFCLADKKAISAPWTARETDDIVQGRFIIDQSTTSQMVIILRLESSCSPHI